MRHQKKKFENELLKLMQANIGGNNNFIRDSWIVLYIVLLYFVLGGYYWTFGLKMSFLMMKY